MFRCFMFILFLAVSALNSLDILNNESQKSGRGIIEFNNDARPNQNVARVVKRSPRTRQPTKNMNDWISRNTLKATTPSTTTIQDDLHELDYVYEQVSKFDTEYYYDQTGKKIPKPKTSTAKDGADMSSKKEKDDSIFDTEYYYDQQTGKKIPKPKTSTAKDGANISSTKEKDDSIFDTEYYYDQQTGKKIPKPKTSTVKDSTKNKDDGINTQKTAGADMSSTKEKEDGMEFPDYITFLHELTSNIPTRPTTRSRTRRTTKGIKDWQNKDVKNKSSKATTSKTTTQITLLTEDPEGRSTQTRSRKPKTTMSWEDWLTRNDKTRADGDKATVDPAITDIVEIAEPFIDEYVSFLDEYISRRETKEPSETQHSLTDSQSDSKNEPSVITPSDSTVVVTSDATLEVPSDATIYVPSDGTVLDEKSSTIVPTDSTIVATSDGEVFILPENSTIVLPTGATAVLQPDQTLGPTDTQSDSKNEPSVITPSDSTVVMTSDATLEVPSDATIYVPSDGTVLDEKSSTIVPTDSTIIASSEGEVFILPENSTIKLPTGATAVLQPSKSTKPPAKPTTKLTPKTTPKPTTKPTPKTTTTTRTTTATRTTTTPKDEYVEWARNCGNGFYEFQYATIPWGQEWYYRQYCNSSAIVRETKDGKAVLGLLAVFRHEVAAPYKYIMNLYHLNRTNYHFFETMTMCKSRVRGECNDFQIRQNQIKYVPGAWKYRLLYNYDTKMSKYPGLDVYLNKTELLQLHPELTFLQPRLRKKKRLRGSTAPQPLAPLPLLLHATLLTVATF